MFLPSLNWSYISTQTIFILPGFTLRDRDYKIMCTDIISLAFQEQVSVLAEERNIFLISVIAPKYNENCSIEVYTCETQGLIPWYILL